MNSRKAVLENFRRENFIKFVRTLDQVIARQKSQVNAARKKGIDVSKIITHEGYYLIPFADFNASLQKEFDIVNEISCLIFGCKSESMFVMN